MPGTFPSKRHLETDRLEIKPAIPADLTREEFHRWAERVRSGRGDVTVVALIVLTVIGTFVIGSASWVLSAVAADSSNFAVVAGNSTSSTTPTPDGSAALSTSLYGPDDVAVDAAGNSIICDTYDNELEVLATSSTNPGYALGGGASWQPGNLYVIAGAGTSPNAPTSSGSSALSTGLNAPEGIAIDHEGNIVVADTDSNLVAIIAVNPTNPGYDVSSWTRGNIYAIAGNALTDPAPSYAGSSATTVGLDAPAGVGVDAGGNIVISDTFASETRRPRSGRRQPRLRGRFELNMDRRGSI